jgi:hypothetical protein
LTEGKDKLTAFSGLANSISRRIGGTYWSGIWKEELVNTLLWSRADKTLPKPKEPRGRFLKSHQTIESIP